MKTLEEVEAYFRDAGYIVRQGNPIFLFDTQDNAQNILVFGRLSPVRGMDLYGAGSAVVIVYSGGNWILRTKIANRFQDEPFTTLESLLIAAEEILGPPKEPLKDA
jgi:hypothetical protein